MMDIFYAHPLHALIISNAVLLFCGIVAILRLERLVKRNPGAMLAGSLEPRLAQIHEQIDKLVKQKASTTTAQPAELLFENAVRMVKHGASADDLTRNCGLNKAEARLMWRLHAEQRKAQASSPH